MIAVTGASGLVGSHLILKLAKAGHSIRAICRHPEKRDKTLMFLGLQEPKAAEILSEVEWVSADITDVLALNSALSGCDKVYHCAALVSYQESDKDLLYQINAIGTANLVNICLELGLEKLVYLSSTAALGTPDEDGKVHEESQWKNDKNISGYSLSKYQAEKEVWRGIEEGLNAAILNPCIILGPADYNTGSSALFSKVDSGMKFYPTGGNAWVDVEDVCEALIQLMNSDIHAERFIIIGENKDFKYFFSKAAQLIGKPAPKYQAGPLLSGLAWRVDKVISALRGKDAVLTKQTARAAQKTTVYQDDKIRAKLNLKPLLLDELLEKNAQLYLKWKAMD